MHSDEHYMQFAITEAHRGESLGEVPVGAVIVDGDGNVVAHGHNRNLLDRDPTGHAEMVALRAAANELGNHRLLGCTLFVTIEPCAMCAGAMIHARLARLVYGADDVKAGAVHSVMQVLNHPALNHHMDVRNNVLAAECGALMQDFFRKKRAAK
jgi:tRNA(adenine34) deaminase